MSNSKSTLVEPDDEARHRTHDGMINELMIFFVIVTAQKEQQNHSLYCLLTHNQRDNTTQPTNGSHSFSLLL